MHGLPQRLARATRAAGGDLGRWARRAQTAFLVLAGGAVVGTQIANPNNRVLQVLAGVAVVAAALKVESLVGLLILIPLLPFPKLTTYGSTNLAFVLFIFVVWFARVTLRAEKAGGRSALDLPILLLVCAYMLSFSQIDDYSILRLALTNFFRALTFIALCYLVIQLVQTEKHLKQVVTSILIMATLVQLTAVYELFFPLRALIPGWIDLSAGKRVVFGREGFEITNLRIGGAFQDYELLAEFSAMILILQIFVLIRTRGLWPRLGISAMALLGTFVMLATVTRGAIVALAVAGIYLLWRSRRHIRFHVLAIVTACAVGGGWFMLEVVSSYTRSGNLLERFLNTEFRGVVPDTRQNVWRDAWERVMESPVLGHGPYFSRYGGVRTFFWPHNNYLFYWHIIGIVGLSAFLFVLWRLWRSSDDSASSFGHPNYSRGLLLALRGMLILFVIDQIKIDYIRNPTYSYWVWLFFGTIVATSRVTRSLSAGHEAEETPRPPGRRAGLAPISERPAA